MKDWNDAILDYAKPTPKRLHKCGTLAIDIVETTPIVWKGKLWRFEWFRSFGRARDLGLTNATCPGYRFVCMEPGSTETSPIFAQGCSFGSAYCENDTMYVIATSSKKNTDSNGHVWEGRTLDLFVSKDLEHWDVSTAISFPEGWDIYNTSFCKGDGEYVMAIEIGNPKELVGYPFTMVFAHSKDLYHWELFDPTKYVHTKDRYSACPVIRYEGGYYYMIYLEEMPLSKFVPYIARSKNLYEWEIAPDNPVLFYNMDEDKKIAPGITFNEKQLAFINESLDINNSDVDLCDYNGKTVILYSWGDQHGREFLAMAEYDGSMREFFESFYCD